MIEAAKIAAVCDKCRRGYVSSVGGVCRHLGCGGTVLAIVPIQNDVPRTRRWEPLPHYVRFEWVDKPLE